jgi:phosphate transport system substrate-binding protein
MTAATWILIYKTAPDAAATTEALKFFAWSYSKGQTMAKDLDYVPMPANTVADIQKMWGTDIKDSSGKSLFALTH